MIAAKTIRLIAPRITDGNSDMDDILVEQESHLRRSAYQSTTIQTGDSFFNDSDMTRDYHLIVVYDVGSCSALLTARYYDLPGSLHLSGISKDIDDYFLIDRMSANTNSLLYRRLRN